MKHRKNMLETSTLPMDDAIAPAPGSAPAPVSAASPVTASASTAAKKTFASIVKTKQPTIVKPSDNDVVVASKSELMTKANEALKKVNNRNCRVANKGALFVEVSSENYRENAHS